MVLEEQARRGAQTDDQIRAYVGERHPVDWSRAVDLLKVLLLPPLGALALAIALCWALCAPRLRSDA